MAKWLKITHQSLLIAMVIALGAVTLKSLLWPTQSPQSLGGIHTSINFPDILKDLELPHWQPISQTILSQEDVNDVVPGHFEQGNNQVFLRQGMQLTVQQAVVSHSDGDLKKYLKTYTHDLASILQHHEAVGDYAVFIQDADQLTMMGCITANQQATVTADQFKVSQIKGSFRLAQIGSWLTNRSTLIPHVCHWRSLSIEPLTSASPELLLELWQILDN